MKKLMQLSLAMALALSGYTALGQTQGVSISETEGIQPHASAMLEVHSNDKGVLIPSFDLASLTDVSSTAAAPAEGLLVYNTNATLGVGFYYWSVNRWNKVGSSGNTVQYFNYTEAVAYASTLSSEFIGTVIFISSSNLADATGHWRMIGYCASENTAIWNKVDDTNQIAKIFKTTALETCP